MLAATTTSLQGNIHDNAEVTFDQGTTGNYAGTMTGSGSLTRAEHRHPDPAGAQHLRRRHHRDGRTLQAPPVTLQGDIPDNAACLFNQSTTGILRRHHVGHRQRDQDGTAP